MREPRGHQPIARDPGHPGKGAPMPRNERPRHDPVRLRHREAPPPPPRYTPRQARHEAARRRERDGCSDSGCSCCMTGVVACVIAVINRLFRHE